MGMLCSCAAVLMICILINTGGCFLNIPVNDKAKNEGMSVYKFHYFSLLGKILENLNVKQ